MIPPYPTTQRIASDLLRLRSQLLSDIHFMEKSIGYRDFRCFAKLAKARIEFSDINKRLDTEIMRSIIRRIK
jgi:hypothetical protein